MNLSLRSSIVSRVTSKACPSNTINIIFTSSESVNLSPHILSWSGQSSMSRHLATSLPTSPTEVRQMQISVPTLSRTGILAFPLAMSAKSEPACPNPATGQVVPVLAPELISPPG